jgi:prepilin-type N-terminal cleavage/methylation domain-containing protein
MRTCDAPEEGENGFTLIEVVVAMVVFTVMAGSVLGILIQIARTTGDNLRRTTASNLASQEIEKVRSLNLTPPSDGSAWVDPLPLGSTTINPRVGKIDYIVKRSVTIADKDLPDSGCSAGTVLSYKAVRVDVSWPNMGSRKPIRADTLRAVGVGTISGLKGTAQVTVDMYDGPVSGLPVTMVPASGPTPAAQNTLDDGCASFSGLEPGSYTAGVNVAGYVGTANQQAVTQSPVTVSVTAPARQALKYAAPRSVNVVLDLPSGSALTTAGVVPRLDGTYAAFDGSFAERTINACTSTSTSECATGMPGMFKNLYPDTYTIKAGRCVETNASSNSIVLTGAASVVPTVTVPLGAITVKVQKLDGSAIVGRQITFTHATPATGCETYTTNSVGAGSMIALPYGAWNVSTTTVLTGTGTILSVPVTVSPSQRTGSAVLTVIS